MAESAPTLTLSDYAYARQRDAGRGVRSGAHSHSEWVLVDEQDVVLEVFQGPEPGAAALNTRFDADPTSIARLRLVVIGHGGDQRDEWPRGGSPAERAGALARRLNTLTQLTEDVLEEGVRGHYLRSSGVGHIELDDKHHRCLELWWYQPDGEQETVGLLVERLDEGAWQLLLDGRTRGLERAQLHQRIAQVMELLGDGRWTVADVAQVRADLDADRDALDALGPSGVCVEAMLTLATALHATEPLGRSWP
jgi:hypothetical protein